MEDEKSIAGKLSSVISKAADTVKHAVSHVVESASEAAQHAMEANAEKISRIPPARPAPGQVAGTTNEQVYIPETSDAVAMPMPLIPLTAPKKQKSVARPAPAGKTPAKQASQSAKTKTAAKRPAARPVPKARKKAAAKKTGKAAKKSAVRSSKKARRKSAR
jgi:hypothetical protein